MSACENENELYDFTYVESIYIVSGLVTAPRCSCSGYDVDTWPTSWLQHNLRTLRGTYMSCNYRWTEYKIH